MSKTDTGVPAFPLHPEIRPSLDTEWCGMTLRDYFAAKAMLGLLAGFTEGVPPADVTAEAAYSYADAMLKVRKQ